ncbi:hypothetical protein TNCV_3854931 [Trichonephila clavipes]|nr:hypothetical protein TNCV_3854931 [Trichonephila clavipes]
MKRQPPLAKRHYNGWPVPSISGIGSWQACHEFEPSIPKDLSCRAAMNVKSVGCSNVLPLGTQVKAEIARSLEDRHQRISMVTELRTNEYCHVSVRPIIVPVCKCGTELETDPIATCMEHHTLGQRGNIIAYDIRSPLASMRKL